MLFNQWRIKVIMQEGSLSSEKKRHQPHILPIPKNLIKSRKCWSACEAQSGSCNVLNGPNSCETSVYLLEHKCGVYLPTKKGRFLLDPDKVGEDEIVLHVSLTTWGALQKKSPFFGCTPLNEYSLVSGNKFLFPVLTTDWESVPIHKHLDGWE